MNEPDTAEPAASSRPRRGIELKCFNLHLCALLFFADSSLEDESLSAKTQTPSSDSSRTEHACKAREQST